MHPFENTEKQESPSAAAAEYAKAKEQYEAGAFPDCFSTLLSGLKKDGEYQPLYLLAAETADKLDAYREQSLFQYAADNMQDASAFYELGEYFFEWEKYDLADIFYEKTLQLDPKHHSAAHDLALSLARRFRNEDALNAMMRSSSPGFWELYLLSKLALFRESTSEKELESIDKTLTLHEEAIVNSHLDEEDKALCIQKIDEIREWTTRFVTVPDRRTHIRDWQYIQYGSTMLDFHDDRDMYVAGGRYVVALGTTQTIRSLADKMKQLIERLAVPIQGVAALDDRDSEIVGRLFAKVLAVPFAFYNPSDANKDCLIVASTSRHLYGYSALSRIQNGQIVFALNHYWLRPTKITPDIIGLMAQQYQFPWDGGGVSIRGGESGHIEVSSRDDRPAEEIASEIFHTRVPVADIKEHLDFYAERRQYLKGIGESAGTTRYEFSIESAVPGSFFL